MPGGTGRVDVCSSNQKEARHRLSGFAQWRWHPDEVFVSINGENHYLWRTVDHDGEVLEVFVTKRHGQIQERKISPEIRLDPIFNS